MTRELAMAEVRCLRCWVLLGSPTADGEYFTIPIPAQPCACGSREIVFKLREPCVRREESKP